MTAHLLHTIAAMTTSEKVVLSAAVATFLLAWVEPMQ